MELVNVMSILEQSYDKNNVEPNKYNDFNNPNYTYFTIKKF